MFQLFDISGSSMTAHKTWTETIGNNISNIQTTRTENGGPYQRQTVTFEEKKDFENIMQKERSAGVQVGNVLHDDSTRNVYQPDHPDANEEGYVEFPEINITSEMTDLLMAQRGYEASATALDTAKKMMQKTLEIGR